MNKCTSVLSLARNDISLIVFQNARKDDDSKGSSDSSSSHLPVNIANGTINFSMGKMLPTVGGTSGVTSAMTPSIRKEDVLHKPSDTLPIIKQSLLDQLTLEKGRTWFNRRVPTLNNTVKSAKRKKKKFYFETSWSCA
jgi:hypothetical protein